MTMSPGLRKLALTAHVVSSVSWLGAVGAFLALAVFGLVNDDALRVRGAYVALEPITTLVIVPLCFASLITGLVSSLGTPWGLFRHWWVIAKLVLTIPSTLILLVHTMPIGDLSRAATAAVIGPGDLRDVRLQLTLDAAAAIVVLLVTTTLAVYKPRGTTRYGQRKIEAERTALATNPGPA